MSSDDDKTVVYPDEGEGWIVESLRWPTQKGEEGKEKETEGKRKRGRPTEDHRDMEAPSVYSDSDDEACWVKPLLGSCYPRGNCFCGLCLIVDRQKLWRMTRRHNLLLDRTMNCNEQVVEKLKAKIRKLETQNGTLKSLRTVSAITKADKIKK